MLVTLFLKGRFYKKIIKNYITYKIYTYMYIPPPAAYTNTIYNTKLIDIISFSLLLHQLQPEADVIQYIQTI